MVGLVTGANRGLGLELIKRGLERGDRMVACWLGGDEDGTALRDLVVRYPGMLTMVQMDVSSERSVADGAGIFGGHFDHLDYIVNNAGVLFESKFDAGDPIADLDIAMLRRTLEVNTVGPAIVLKAFIPYIYKSEEPCIINITSEAGHLAPGGHVYAAYSISKHALNMYTQKIRNYLVETPGRERVRIYMVHPGRMQTVMGRENAQIDPSQSSTGIFQMIDKTLNPKLDVPFVNYKGEQMPY